MIYDLHKAMSTLGYNIELSKINADSTIVRFDKDGKKNAWLVAHQNTTTKGDPYIVAEFGDWKTGEREKYVSTVKMTAHDKVAMNVAIANNAKKIKDEKNRIQNQAADDALAFWATCQDNPNSEYLKKKNISKLYGAKTTMGYNGRDLIVPYFDVDGKLWGYQTIMPGGQKRFGSGQKKQGNFFVVPFLDALIDQETVYIAEGFATAASIYEATGFAVVVAFDCGNMLHVAKNIKTKYNDKPIIVCADDDIVGVEQATRAADSVLGKVVVPVFSRKVEGKTDFNDLAAVDGSGAVREQIMGVKPKIDNVRCLGYSGDNYYFISTSKSVVTAISKTSFTKQTLMDLMPLEYWEQRFPKSGDKGGIDMDKATDTLMRICREIGKFSPNNIRGAGVWRDYGEVFVNVGDSIWVGGEHKPLLQSKSKYIYQNSKRIKPPRADFATPEQVQDFFRLLEKLSWKDDTYPKLLLGWLMIAPVCGALKWRPHLWITGSSGSGKSEITERIVGRILDGKSFKFMGRSTEAGIRQQIEANALPILFDENETTDRSSGQRVGSVVELFRQASSEGDAQVVKGSAGGQAVAFHVRFVALVSSITVSLTNAQDLNRFSVLELKEDKNNGYTDVGGTRDQLENLMSDVYIEQFTSRSIYKFDLIRANIKVFYNALHKKVNARFADQYGTLLAGYFAGIQDTPISREDALRIVSEEILLDTQQDESSIKEEQACYEYLMSKVIREGHNYSTVANLVHSVQNYDSDVSNSEKILANHGMKVMGDFLAIQSKNPELQMLFRDSPWFGGWSRTLSRLKDSESRFTARITKTPVRCVKVKIVT